MLLSNVCLPLVPIPQSLRGSARRISKHPRRLFLGKCNNIWKKIKRSANLVQLHHTSDQNCFAVIFLFFSQTFLRHFYGSCRQCASRWKHIQDNGARGLQTRSKDGLFSLEAGMYPEQVISPHTLSQPLFSFHNVHVFGLQQRKSSQAGSEHADSTWKRLQPCVKPRTYFLY